ncbi:MAG TPA: M14 family zinc carboxypeptidase [Planctomycetota bacterium]|nr:M14 family zinc carboxypeptidase [Planctomycetota bacterium]
MRFTTLALGALLCHTALSAQDDPLSLLYLVKDPTAGQRLLLQQHFDVLGSCCGSAAQATGPVEVVVQQEEVPALLSIVPAAELVRIGRPFHDVELERAAASGEDVPDPGYYTVAEIEAAIDAQVAAYPGLARKVDLSALPGGVLTHEGRPIFALKVSDNVAIDEDEPAIVLAAQHHARELNSPHMVIGAMQRVLAAYASDPTLHAIVDSYEIYFVPMVNPDGVNFVWTSNDLWRKNRRNNGGGVYGVDNNRNYPFLWGLCGSSTSTSNETYRGPSAGSEPETMVMRNLVARLRPEIYLDFHSYGRDVLRMWAPCATVNPTMYTFQQLYCDDLRNQMGFSTRDPSGSGEAPEDHYSSGGALSFLIEVGTAFQPAFSATVAEEAIVWPGIQRVLTNWRPALRGHVRSALGSAPLASTITFTPNVFNHGEKTMSRASDGRYALWLPLGSWSVTFAAPGHQSRTVPISVASYNSPVLIDVMLETAGPTATTTKVGTGSIGTTVTYTYTSPGDAGKLAFFGWAFDTVPGISLGDLRVIPINNDFLFQNAWIGNPFLSPTWVTLSGADQGQAVLIIPNESWLIGLTTYVNGITFDPLYQTGIKTWSQAVGVTIIP